MLIFVSTFALVAVGMLLADCFARASASTIERAAQRWVTASHEVSMPERSSLRIECSTRMCQVWWLDRDEPRVDRGAMHRRVSLICDDGMCVEASSPCW